MNLVAISDFPAQKHESFDIWGYNITFSLLCQIFTRIYYFSHDNIQISSFFSNCWYYYTSKYSRSNKKLHLRANSFVETFWNSWKTELIYKDHSIGLLFDETMAKIIKFNILRWSNGTELSSWNHNLKFYHCMNSWQLASISLYFLKIIKFCLIYDEYRWKYFIYL